MRPLLLLAPLALLAASAFWYVQRPELPPPAALLQESRAARPAALALTPERPPVPSSAPANLLVARGERIPPERRAPSASALPATLRRAPALLPAAQGATEFPEVPLWTLSDRPEPVIPPVAVVADPAEEVNGGDRFAPSAQTSGRFAMRNLAEPAVPAPLPAGLVEPVAGLPRDELREQRIEQLRDEWRNAVGERDQTSPDGGTFTDRYLRALSNFDQQFIAIYGYEAYSQQQAWVVRHDPQ